MKATSWFWLGAVVAAVSTFLVSAMLHNSYGPAMMKSLFRSEMHAVGRMLDDLQAHVQQGDHKLVERKLALWQQRWAEYLRGGPPPETFCNEVIELEMVEQGAPVATQQ